MKKYSEMSREELLGEVLDLKAELDLLRGCSKKSTDTANNNNELKDPSELSTNKIYTHAELEEYEGYNVFSCFRRQGVSEYHITYINGREIKCYN